jgi:RNA polymerase sigma-70 factor (ECF subfamily)
MLITHIRNGDESAFEQLFVRFAAPLADCAMAYVHSREVAEDLVHDLFLTLWRDRAAWKPVGTIEAYLFLALRNRARSYLRRERVAANWKARAVQELAAASAPPGPDERMEAAERQAAVVRTITTLPERTRLVATLRWIDGLTYAEIAQRAGITVKGVEKAIARAFFALEQRLRP